MHGNILPKQSVSVKVFHKVLLKEMCFSQYFNMCMEKFYWNKCVLVGKTARTVLYQKCFSHIFTKFCSNKCVSFNILICTWKCLLKQSVSIEKKGKNCAWSKVFLSHFYKVLLKQMCFGQYFNMCMETFYQNKVFLFKFFIKFYWNKCVSGNILICTCKNSIKTLCFGRKKKTQELCLIKSVSLTFS